MTQATLETLDAVAESANQQYRDLVFSLAEGRPLAADAILKAASSTGRTIDDVRRHVALAKRRRQAVQNLERADAIEAALPELSATYEDALAARDVVQSEVDRIVAERLDLANEKLRQAYEAVREARREARTLRTEAHGVLAATSAPGQAVQMNRLRNELRRLQDRAYALGSRIDLEARLRLARGDLSSLSNRDLQYNGEALARKGQLTELIEGLERRLVELAEIEPQLSEAERRLQDAETEAATDWRSVEFD
ncbi:MAG: hypothetical protein KDA61_21285 [Planctomycetales bacterium]|nr:hypothetical protein [Planctomycetales bacterium]